jgi:hypothetical protein
MYNYKIAILYVNRDLGLQWSVFRKKKRYEYYFVAYKSELTRFGKKVLCYLGATAVLVQCFTTKTTTITITTTTTTTTTTTEQSK